MKAERILSIDIFRGLTIFLMVFVNDLAGVSNIPAWMKHVAADVDGMTFVDVVFPAFLFIVGMAIPFAAKNREAKGESQVSIWKHVLLRTLALLILGVYMVNSGEMNSEASLIPKSIWSVAFYLAAIAIWNNYPKTEDKGKRQWYLGLKILGIGVLILLYFLFRKGSEGALSGMTPSWWGILGLIGWAYLVSFIIFKASAQKVYYLVGHFLWMFLLLLFLRKMASDSGPGQTNWLMNQTGHLAHSLIAISGMICSFLLMRKSPDNSWKVPLRNILIFGVFLLLAAYFALPFGGISKIGASPSWALYSASICCFIFPLIYWLVDIKGHENWANFLKPAGTNPLLTYILPPIFYAIAGFSIWPDLLNSGFPGFIRAILFSLLILWAAAGLSKKGINLRL